MSGPPILDAEAVLAAAVRTALAGVVGTHQGKPKVYYQRNTDAAPLPLVIFFFPVPIAPLRRWIGQHAAVATQVLVKALANDAKAARDLLETTVEPMGALVATGHTIETTYLNSPPIPPIDDLYQSAHLWRITLERSS